MVAPVSGSQVTSEGGWVGRSGRLWRPVLGQAGREGGMAAILAVTGVGPGPGPREGVLVALKLARVDDPLSVEALGKEISVFEMLCAAPGEPPCPRLLDVVDSPTPGLVMEWCPTDLERWWADRHADAGAFAELCHALAEVCRRVREYAVVSELALGRRVVHADIKPRNVLLSESGRWLLTDFGAAKSRGIEEATWAATQMIIGTENYIAPETLFNARKPHPAAVDTWAIGCTFFALLRMRSLLRGGGTMPPNGTHSHHFRCHRTALVADLQLRRPNAFADRDLDPAAFATPDRLPDKDRAAVAEAVAGTFGNPVLDERLAADIVNLLDRALQIDPSRRYLDPLEMASDLEALALRMRELGVRADGGATGSRASAPFVAAPSPRRKELSAPPAASGQPRGLVGMAAGGAAAVIVIAVVGVLLLAWHFAHEPVPVPPMAEVALPPPPPIAKPKLAPGVVPASTTVGGEPGRGTGVVLVFGAEAYLQRAGLKHSIGTLPAGQYKLFAAVGPRNAFVEQARVEVVSGTRLIWHCAAGACQADSKPATGP